MSPSDSRPSLALISRNYGERVNSLITAEPERPPLDGRGGPPHDGGMEQRVKALEDAMIQVRQDLAVIRSNYATKADIAEAKSTIIMWVVAAIFLAQLLPAVPSILRALKLVQ